MIDLDQRDRGRVSKAASGGLTIKPGQWGEGGGS